MGHFVDHAIIDDSISRIPIAQRLTAVGRSYSSLTVIDTLPSGAGAISCDYCIVFSRHLRYDKVSCATISVPWLAN